MKEHPLLLNAEMVRAVLEGRKTQTRRPVKKDEQCLFDYLGNDPSDQDNWFKDEVSLTYVENFTRLDEEKNKEYKYTGFLACNAEYPEEGYIEVKSPYGKIGDRLWVRETFSVLDAYAGYEIYTESGMDFEEGCASVYYLDGTKRRIDGLANHDNGVNEGDQAINFMNKTGLSPSIHMPRWASRILLEVTDIRVERIHDISEADIVAEGIKEQVDCNLHGQFKALWNSLYPDSWDRNEWVWVCDFKVVSTNDTTN